ncbi:hypothetical protein Moror_3276 [Moniliophthora roreri MCA 2997]|uniref:Uncharacterized protein n=2 Tax=Moniliophthora roreri TaxID=221103 RepID=V2XV12_MONRO|nr:hypothetical protein Moror_3276 [Moniliophthora roreri MCA 2997]
MHQYVFRAVPATLAIFRFNSAVAFNVTAPISADVDAVNNIRANWTWYHGGPANVIIQLFVYGEDVCTFGKATPVAMKRIKNDIKEAEEVNGEKFGNVTLQEGKVGKYILCAYADVTPPGGSLKLRSITNSSTFDVERPAVTLLQVNTVTIIGTLTPLPQSTNTAQETRDQEKPSPSPGIIAGTAVGTLAISLLVVVGVVIYQRQRQAKERHSITAESIISPYPDANKSAIEPERKGRRHDVPPQANPYNQREKRTIRQNTSEVQSIFPSPIVNGAPPSRRQRERVVYHDDSGWRPHARASSCSDGGTASVVEMPPRYDAAV